MIAARRPVTGLGAGYPLARHAAARQAGLVSKTAPGEYRGQLFWVFDVCESVLFATMAGIAARAPESERTARLTGLEHQLRVDAILGASQCIALDEWCEGHEEEFIALVAEAARRLAGRGSITAQQAACWIVLDGQPIIWRGQSAVDTAPIVTFAHAMIDIVRGTYPQPPDGLHSPTDQHPASTLRSAQITAMDLSATSSHRWNQ
jgi:hypothetical protein